MPCNCEFVRGYVEFFLITDDCQCRLGTDPETTKNEKLFCTVPPGALDNAHTL